MKKKVLSGALALIWLLCMICLPVTAETTDSRATQLPGDVNCDGVVDNKDVEYLLWYTLFPEDYSLTVDGDFDRSQQVDNRGRKLFLPGVFYRCGTGRCCAHHL